MTIKQKWEKFLTNLKARLVFINQRGDKTTTLKINLTEVRKRVDEVGTPDEALLCRSELSKLFEAGA